MLPDKSEKQTLRRVVTIAVLAPALTISFLFAIIFVRSCLRPDGEGEDITSKLLSNLRFGEVVSINKLIDADTACIVPPDGRVSDFARRNFPDKTTNLVRESDSEESNIGRWRIIAVWDGNKQVKVFDILEAGKNGTIELSSNDRDSHVDICSRDLLIKIESVEGRITAFVQ